VLIKLTTEDRDIYHDLSKGEIVLSHSTVTDKVPNQIVRITMSCRGWRYSYSTIRQMPNRLQMILSQLYILWQRC